MKILWFNWKDNKNPKAGGAERVNEAIAKQFTAAGHEIIYLVSGFSGGQHKEIIDNYQIIRLGNQWTVYWQAYRYYKKNLIGWADIIIDEVNTIPFFVKWYAREKNILLIYQLCRQIWFYQIFFPINILGYLLEPIYLRLLNDRYTLTESESTKNDLQRYGFQKDKISIFPIGLEEKPLSHEEYANQQKNKNPVMLYFGALRKMKRPDHVLRAFEMAKENIKDLKFWIAGGGDGPYANTILDKLKKSKYKEDITYFGAVSQKRKFEIMQKSHVIAVTSVKEGWGIIITEANGQGTPAVVYNIDGLRDACKDGITGIVCKKNTPEELAKNITRLLSDKKLYEKYQDNAWNDAHYYTYENSYEIFIKSISNLIEINSKI